MPTLRETLIKCLATANAADLPHNFGKNAQNITSIPALFAYAMHQNHQRFLKYRIQVPRISILLR
jgi:hypothetical protein